MPLWCYRFSAGAVLTLFAELKDNGRLPSLKEMGTLPLFSPTGSVKAAAWAADHLLLPSWREILSLQKALLRS